jgi:beta-phosphoglucomutase-like phosphatase (HAD superfamily)
LIKAVIFDFNGVIDEIDKERLKAIEKVLEKFSEEEILKEKETYAKEILVIIERIDTYNPLLSMKEIVHKAFEEFFREKGISYENLDELVEIYFKERGNFREISKSFKELLDYLTSKDIKIFIVSHASKEYIIKTLEKSGINPKMLTKIY